MKQIPLLRCDTYPRDLETPTHVDDTSTIKESHLTFSARTVAIEYGRYALSRRPSASGGADWRRNASNAPPTSEPSSHAEVTRTWPRPSSPSFVPPPWRLLAPHSDGNPAGTLSCFDSKPGRRVRATGRQPSDNSWKLLAFLRHYRSWILPSGV
jgi:hypothetical protein